MSNATQLLLRKARILNQQPHNSWRCIYLNFSDKKHKYSYLLRAQCGIKIAELLSDNEGTIYLCGDGDIFILFEGAVRPIARKLAACFGDLEIARFEASETNPFTVFDLGMDWQAFFDLCHAKAFHDIPAEALPAPMHGYALAAEQSAG